MERAISFMTFLALSAASDAQAQMAGNPREGLASAQQVCSQCHAVRIGQANSANSKGPSFVELATTPGMTGIPLFTALTASHAGMPIFKLTGAQRDGIIAYVLSLKADADD